MKIALIVPGFSADERDWCIPALLDLARSLSAANEVHIFALRYPHQRAVYRIGNFTVHSFNGRVRRGAASAQLWATLLNALAQEQRRAPFDVLHAVYGGEAGWVAVLAARLVRAPGIVSLVGGELVGLADIQYGADLQRRQRWMNRLTLRLADSILCGSESLSVAARARMAPARRARAQTLPLGVDTELFTPAPRSGQAGVNILNVGSLIPVKDQRTLLHALAQLRHAVPNARLTIAGTGVLQQELSELAVQLGIAGQVDLVGAIPHEELPGWYRRADLFVQSSRHEGEGLAVLEAAACGTALAGTAVGILADLAERGAALAVPPHDPTALARAMQQALAARAGLSACARQVVAREYSLPVIRDRLLELYRSLPDQGGEKE